MINVCGANLVVGFLLGCLLSYLIALVMLSEHEKTIDKITKNVMRELERRDNDKCKS